MKTKLLLLITLVSLSLTNYAAPKLGENSIISIITCAPGADLYSTFGHTAVRIQDPTKKMDIVFNYGAFDFNTDNFYLKFTRGQLDYMLSTAYFKNFTKQYYRSKRAMREQVLNLTETEAQEVFNFLSNNAKPENKFYHYDFFYDNCSTRIRDMLQEVLKQKLILGINEFNNEESFRDMIDLYLNDLKWWQLGINVALGLPCDKKVSSETSVFLPDYLFLSFKNAKVVRNGVEEPLVKTTATIYDPKVAKTERFYDFTSPIPVFWLLFFITVLVSLLEIKKKKWYRIFDNTLFFATGLFGILVFLLWTSTDHLATVNNWNLLWMTPLHPVAIFFATNSKFPKFTKYYFLGSAILASSAFALSMFIPQRYDLAFYPIMLALGLRSALIYSRTKKTNALI